MARTSIPWIVAILLGGTVAGQEAPPPVASDKVEQEQVKLVILDVVVVDREGRTVDDLTADDFEIRAGGRPVSLGTLDVDCPAGPTADPPAVRRASKRQPVSPGGSRKLVLALDYLHMVHTRRAEVLQGAREAVRHGAAPGDEIMVVALNGGLRIEQPFTRDHEQVLASLTRMEYDITLWEPEYFHTHESVFVEPLIALLDMLEQVPGNKAVVLYSTMSDVPLDSEFRRIAAIAATSRCSIYPVDAAGLRTPIGGPEAGAG